MENTETRFKEILSILKECNLKEGMTPKKLCNILEKLGPTFIKIGQILSTRVDLLPEEYISELSKLRSNASKLDFSVIENILNTEYKDYNKHFSYVNKRALGSASIAQVHKAKLKDGTEVILKIKRPNVEEKLSSDIMLLKRSVNVLHLNNIIKVIDLNEALDELYTVTKEEINFNVEVSHLKKFYENNKNVEYLHVPKVYEELCTKNIIVMEYIDGDKINNISELSEKGYNPSDIAKKLSENYIKQALDDGFFHADPHPDNILISNGKIVFIDLGMMGTLTNKSKNVLKKCIKDIIFKDYYEVSRDLILMSTQNGEVDYVKLRKDVTNILEEFGTVNLDNIDTSKFISKMFKMLKDNNLILDRDITMLIRGIGIIEAVLEELDPKINLISVLSNRKEFYINKELVKNVGREIIKNGEKILDVPSELLNLTRSLNNGEIKLKFELSDSENKIDKIEHLLHELIIGFIIGCLIISASLITDYYVRSIVIIIIAILSFILLVKMFIDKNHKG